MHFPHTLNKFLRLNVIVLITVNLLNALLFVFGISFIPFRLKEKSLYKNIKISLLN